MRKDTDSSPTYAHAWKWGINRCEMIKAFIATMVRTKHKGFNPS